MDNPIDISNIRIITVSGRIASGSTTLANKLAQVINWKHIEGGEIFWEAVRKKENLSPKDTNQRPDQEDILFDKELKHILQQERNLVLETKLAGFNAQNIKNIFKVRVLCADTNGEDQTQIRIDRLVNREHLSIDEAKEEVVEREKNDIGKWRKLYVNNDPKWTYMDEKYYDLTVNTFSHNPDESLEIVLKAIGYTDQK